ncbi:hypothetical protein [Streptomyces sp. NBC_00078]|uniref:hypothetical protein n=1 Tax=unclassified Streptomyces TaxID=2593676 RepID=UPI00225BFA90|nr:hypothetical protein [Streptomyces sp. NBC_00078]MCX5424654.1 hypothetical protein [Streptomyces sp. NBC_00078]
MRHPTCSSETRAGQGHFKEYADTRSRQDRILNEAFDMGDPLKLMRLFGITEKTAMHYVGVAHPAKTAQLPR